MAVAAMQLTATATTVPIPTTVLGAVVVFGAVVVGAVLVFGAAVVVGSLVVFGAAVVGAELVLFGAAVVGVALVVFGAAVVGAALVVFGAAVVVVEHVGSVGNEQQPVIGIYVPLHEMNVTVPPHDSTKMPLPFPETFVAELLAVGATPTLGTNDGGGRKNDVH